jgi:uncharacterized protein (DUF1501 family)
MNAQALSSRRRFLGQTACSAVTATPLLSTILNLKMAGNAAAASSDPNDYKALVCLFQGGGNDSFNMLVPRGASEYAEYQATRSDLALAQNTLLPLNGTHGGKTFGVHAGMSEVQALYNSGDLAFVSNVGTLVEPVTLAQVENESARLPLGLYSHNDQITHWQTSVPDRRSAIGWGGRVADLLDSSNSNDNISMSISLSGTNTFQAGESTVSYEIESSGNGAIVLADYAENDNPTLTNLGKTAVNSLMDLEYQNLFQKTFAQRNRNAIDASVEFSDAIAGVSAISTPFSTNGISNAFRMIAKTIAARDVLGMKRQTFFIMFGGWDHHDELINAHAAMLPVVSKGIAEFHAAMGELGVADKVTTFTASDFARTLSSNGRGSDHAWGSNHMVCGGAVQGGQIYGDYPDLGLGSSLDTGRGRLIPTMATDEYFADLARWFGVSDADMPTVFPNLDRFYTIGPDNPVGFMG